ncbi:unnamed protein product [Prorocentrum cordatum]|uniref:Uncharacterized protein n=1 Tax=Prorocentrum cordatum TaxID=2364126 RepID=A0ABN9S301_9DINO|nr:unnamed protein product [Polarella glacialis]
MKPMAVDIGTDENHMKAEGLCLEVQRPFDSRKHGVFLSEGVALHGYLRLCGLEVRAVAGEGLRMHAGVLTRRGQEISKPPAVKPVIAEPGPGVLPQLGAVAGVGVGVGVGVGHDGRGPGLPRELRGMLRLVQRAVLPVAVASAVLLLVQRAVLRVAVAGCVWDSEVAPTVLADLRSHPPPVFAEAAPELAAAQRWEPPRPATPSEDLLPRAGAHVLASPVARPPLPAERRQPHAPAAGAAAGRSRGGSDESLVASMAARLAQVEQLNKQLSARVAKQAQELAAVRGELDRARDAPGARPQEVGAAAAPGDCVSCRALRRQVDELSGIVEAYGLVWTPAAAAAEEEPTSGGGGVPTASPASGGGAAGSPASARGRGIHRPDGHRPPEGGVSVDIEVLRSRVEGLNASVEDDRPRVVAEGGGGGGRARLAADAAGPLPVTFFQELCPRPPGPPPSARRGAEGHP